MSYSILIYLTHITTDIYVKNVDLRDLIMAHLKMTGSYAYEVYLYLIIVLLDIRVSSNL